jgi:hypothetical protein
VETKTTRGRRWLIILGLGLVLVLGLAGCMPPMYGPSLPPPAPPAPPAPPPQVARPSLYVAVNRLNLRAGPGMDFPKIAVLQKNEEVQVVGQVEDCPWPPKRPRPRKRRRRRQWRRRRSPRGPRRW